VAVLNWIFEGPQAAIQVNFPKDLQRISNTVVSPSSLLPTTPFAEKHVAPMATATKYPDSQNTAGTLALPFAKAAPCAVTPCANKNRDVQNVSESGRSGEPLATSQ